MCMFESRRKLIVITCSGKLTNYIVLVKTKPHTFVKASCHSAIFHLQIHHSMPDIIHSYCRAVHSQQQTPVIINNGCCHRACWLSEVWPQLPSALRCPLWGRSRRPRWATPEWKSNQQAGRQLVWVFCLCSFWNAQCRTTLTTQRLHTKALYKKDASDELRVQALGVWKPPWNTLRTKEDGHVHRIGAYRWHLAGQLAGWHIVCDHLSVRIFTHIV